MITASASKISQEQLLLVLDAVKEVFFKHPEPKLLLPNWSALMVKVLTMKVEIKSTKVKIEMVNLWSALLGRTFKNEAIPKIKINVSESENKPDTSWVEDSCKNLADYF